MAEWKVGFVLPNCSIAQAIDSEYVALVPFGDNRLRSLIATNRAAQMLVEGFQDHYTRPVQPSVLLSREDAPAPVVSDPGLIGFRNAVTLAHITKEWSWKISKRHSWGPIWSDYFAIFPVRPAKDKQSLENVNPAMLDLDFMADVFRGQTSPLLPHPSTMTFHHDERLLSGLLGLWRRRFEQGHLGEWTTKALFRSLEVGFQAASVPSLNHATVHDYGTNIALWVSAFEILSHPWRGQANLKTVVDLLAAYEWTDPRLRGRRWRLRPDKRRIAVTFAQRLYRELYEARNAFLHGNAVDASHLRAFGASGKVPLLGIAPLLYRAALYGYFQKIGIRLSKKPLIDFDGQAFEKAMTTIMYSNQKRGHP